MISSRIRGLRGCRILTEDEEERAAQLAANGDTQARNSLILSMARLAALVGARFKAKMEEDDRVGSALLSTCEAAQRFKLGTGARFSTYAASTAKFHLMTEAHRLRDEPTTLSLDAPLTDQSGNETDTPLSEVVPDENAPLPDAVAECREMIGRVRDAVEGLPEPERDVISALFALDSDEPQTLERIGARTGMHPTQISRLRDKALVKLRKRFARWQRTL